MRAVYIHIPFCRSICSYCDFCKVIYKEEWAVLYLEKLKEEITDKYMGESINTIYIGGGTPSCLKLDELKDLLELTKIFNIDNLEEFTFECNIDDINEEFLNLLKKYKVSRLSIGIESFDKKNQIFMKRKVNYNDVKNKIELIREKGFNNINLDLIYALPSEQIKTLRKDIKKVLSLKPEHISTYSLMIEDNTYLGYEKTKSIPEELDLKMYKYICRTLKLHGYKHYEISNFSKKGYESKHNLVYWNNLEYYGFGCGASGYIDSIRYDNTRNLAKYLKGYFSENESLISIEGKREYELMLGLRKIDGVNLEGFYKKYHVNMQDVFPIMPLIKNKDLICKKGNIMINPKKLYVMNEILLKLI